MGMRRPVEDNTWLTLMTRVSERIPFSTAATSSAARNSPRGMGTMSSFTP